MGAEGTIFFGDSDCRQCVVDGFCQLSQRVFFLDSGPENPCGARCWKEPSAPELKLKWFGPDGMQGRFDLRDRGVGLLANEFQSYMQRLAGDPARFRGQMRDL